MSFHHLLPISKRHANNNNFAKIWIPVLAKVLTVTQLEGDLGYDYHVPKVTS